jgi:fused signal recognition particle receptor
MPVGDDPTQLVVWLLVGVVLAIALAVAIVVRRRRAGRPVPVQGPSEPARGPRTIRDGLSATRRRLAERLQGVWRGTGERAAMLAELEEALIGADVGVRTSQQLIEHVARTDARGPVELQAVLRREVAAMCAPPERKISAGRPHVVLVTGVNGVGKTTTVGKLAAAAKAEGRRVLLVAADTYRAAAIEQLEAWGTRLGVDVVRHAAGASPAAVAHDGMKAAVGRDADLVLIDTAGRLHTRAPLMDELRKVRRVLGQIVPGAPHETLLVLDASTGQNALTQARVFLEAVDVTGVVLTKLDGTARGGVALAVAHELGLPIAYVGVGEGPGDLRPFDAGEYAEALIGS